MPEDFLKAAFKTEYDPSETPDLETLMRTYGKEVLQTCFSYVKEKSLAEDMFQETFLKAYKYLPTFRGESSIKTWLIRIAINTCKDYLKSAYARNVVPITDFKEETLSSDGDFDDVEKSDTRKLVRESVMKLPEKYRDVVICVYFHEMSLTEAAGVLALPVGTVKSRLSRASEKLRGMLKSS